jgi:nanoRNase/pAp phosphatase (c-di-AMP/oligoRNAs hydrolase)
VPAEYFAKLDATLRAARVHDTVLLAHIGPMNRPDMAAEMADLLQRLRGVQWVVCTGVYKETLVLAIRTRSRRGSAGWLAQEIVGDLGTAGGHGVMAGGQVPLDDQDGAQLAAQLGQLALQALEIDASGEGRPVIGDNANGDEEEQVDG